MNDEAEISMIMCSGLDANEEKKVKRLDNPISAATSAAGRGVRICESRTHDGRRVIEFVGSKVTVLRFLAADFATETDEQTMLKVRQQLDART